MHDKPGSVFRVNGGQQEARHNPCYLQTCIACMLQHCNKACEVSQAILFQGDSEPGLNSVDNLYIPTSSLAICFSILEDSGLSAETYFDKE